MGKKALIITYYWPPSGGGGVQRWLKFAKYLPDFDWQPIIFTPENPDFELQDDTLLKDIPDSCEVLKLPITEPFGVYKKLLGKKANQQQGVVSKGKSSLLGKMAIWVRGNWFIPDARMLWIKPASKFLVKYLKDNPVDVIITTGPPHSMHMIGAAVKKKTGIPWLADFRDPWSQWDVLPQLQLTQKSWEKHKQMEFEVLNMADKVLTVSKRLGQALDELAGVPGVEVITNGFDESDFTKQEPQKADEFVMVHMGLLNEGRNPGKLWRVLNKKCAHDPEFREELSIILAGTIEQGVKEELDRLEYLKERVTTLDYVPHEEALTIYQRASVFLLLVNNTSNSSWIIPGKLYEYLAGSKPILPFGRKESDANDLLEACGYDPFLSYDDQSGIEERINQLYAQYKSGEQVIDPQQVSRFTRKRLTKSLVEILEDLALKGI